MFTGGRALDKSLRNQKGTFGTISAIQSTVLPFSDPHLSSGGSHLYLTWIYDSPGRTAINRSMAVSSSWDGTSWAEPIAIADDGTADFHPQILTFADGTSIAAWENVKSALSDTATLEGLMSNIEISTSSYDPQTNRWAQAQSLTSNGYMDRSPKLAGSKADNTIVVWISNDKNDPEGNSGQPNTLWFSKWNGANWSVAQVIMTVPYPIVKYALTYDGSKGNIVLTMDTDQDTKTIEDHELYYLSYNNGLWSGSSRLTNDTVADDNPQLALDSKGNSVLVWLKGDEISTSTNFDMSSRRIVAQPGYSNSLADFKLATTLEGQIALMWSEPGESSSSDLQAIFYDQNFDVWGNQTQLTSDPEIEKYVTAAFYDQSKLVAVYDRTTDTIPEGFAGQAESGSPSLAIPAPGATDLYMLSFTVGGDLAIKPESLEASPANPRPGEVTMLTATVLNVGNVAVRDVPVSFYQGNPASGGTLIGTTVIPTTLASGHEQQASIPWTPSPTTNPISIYAVVDPNQTFEDSNRSNNSASKQVVKPDLAIENVRWVQESDKSVLVTARVSNLGSLPSGLTNISLRRDATNGVLVSSQPVSVLNPDQSVDIVLQWDLSGLSARDYSLYLLVDPNNLINEYDKANNNSSIVIPLTSETPVVQFGASSVTVNESEAYATVTVIRTGDTSGAATVKYATSDATDVNFNCNPTTSGQIAGAASRKCDYHIGSGRLRFAPGETSKSIILSLVNDVYVEGPEVLTIALSNPTGATLGSPNLATITITDNDAPGQPNPINGTAFYVGMLYVDLLSRQPDPAGYQGWIDRIDKCGQAGQPPPPCDRVTVGGDGFLRSGEFFDREFFVLRLYRAGLGRILVYNDVADLALVSGFLTASDLELNKQDLLAEIMSRPEFSNLYNGLGDSAYVDKLIQTAAVTIPSSVRDGWVTALNGSTKTRAQVFRELSERQEVSDKYLHEAQVVSCYYGFFTRNPDGAYFSYLDRLTRGEITLGDLANAFINAQEYRQRFGP